MKPVAGLYIMDVIEQDGKLRVLYSLNRGAFHLAAFDLKTLKQSSDISLAAYFDEKEERTQLAFRSFDEIAYLRGNKVFVYNIEE